MTKNLTTVVSSKTQTVEINRDSATVIIGERTSTCAGYLFHPQRFLAKNQYKKLSYSLRIRFLPKSMIME